MRNTVLIMLASGAHVKKILSSKMSSNMQTIFKAKNEILKKWKSKISHYNLELIDIKSSLYEIKCQYGHLFMIHKNMLNDHSIKYNVLYATTQVYLLILA